MYLKTYKPYRDSMMNRLLEVNEGFFLIILYHLILFTDYVKDAETKFAVGWSMLLVSMCNFLWPNLLWMVDELRPDIIEAIY